MSWTDDPERDFDRYDRELADKLDRLPRCCCCDEPIQQEEAIYYNDQWCCKECESEFWDDIREDFLESIDW